MAEFENAVADDVVSAMDAADGNGANQGTFAAGAGPGTSTLNYGPGTSQTAGAVADLNGGTGTRSLAGAYVVPTGGAEDADTAQTRADAFAAADAASKRAQAAADESFRRYCGGHVDPSGRVPGLAAPTLNRNKEG